MKGKKFSPTVIGAAIVAVLLWMTRLVYPAFCDACAPLDIVPGIEAAMVVIAAAVLSAIIPDEKEADE